MFHAATRVAFDGDDPLGRILSQDKRNETLVTLFSIPYSRVVLVVLNALLHEERGFRIE